MYDLLVAALSAVGLVTLVYIGGGLLGDYLDAATRRRTDDDEYRE